MFKLLLASAIAIALPLSASRADEKFVTIGICLPFTGAAQDSAVRIKDGALLALNEINAKGGINGVMLHPLLLDNGSSTTGQYDPATAAVNARKMVADPTVVAAIGPMNSGSGKAMSAILSQGNLATITPSSTNPDLTSPNFAATYRPAGKPVYFRSVTTDAFQGPNMANYYADVLKVKRLYVLDDSGAYGVGLANAFEAQAKKKGIEVLGHDKLDPMASDYTPVFTKIKSLNVDAIYLGSSALAAVKAVKQSYDIIPNVIKGGGDGLYESEILTGAGFPAANGWYATIAAPHLVTDPAAEDWQKRYTAAFNLLPSDYAITAYDGMLVIIDALQRVAKAGDITRAAVRDAIQSAHVKTLQGEISFDENGDLASHVISVFQITLDPAYPPGDILHQYKYLGVAPQEAS